MPRQASSWFGVAVHHQRNAVPSPTTDFHLPSHSRRRQPPHLISQTSTTHPSHPSSHTPTPLRHQLIPPSTTIHPPLPLGGRGAGGEGAGKGGARRSQPKTKPPNNHNHHHSHHSKSCPSWFTHQIPRIPQQNPKNPNSDNKLAVNLPFQQQVCSNFPFHPSPQILRKPPSHNPQTPISAPYHAPLPE